MSEPTPFEVDESGVLLHGTKADLKVGDLLMPGRKPARSYRTRDPVRIVGEIVDWVGHSPGRLNAMRERLDQFKRTGADQIDD